MKIIAIACAYEVKDGGFRAVAKDKRDGIRHEGAVHATLQAARNEARQIVATFLGDDYATTRPAPISKKNEWTCNYWVA